MNQFFIMLVWFVIGGVCFHYSKLRGRNPYAWFFIGLFLGLLGVILLFLLPAKTEANEKVAEPPKPAPAPPAHLLQFWYYLDEANRQFGPMSLDALSSSHKEGKIQAQTYVWNETFEEWKRYGEVFPSPEIKTTS